MIPVDRLSVVTLKFDKGRNYIAARISNTLWCRSVKLVLSAKRKSGYKDVCTAHNWVASYQLIIEIIRYTVDLQCGTIHLFWNIDISISRYRYIYFEIWMYPYFNIDTSISENIDIHISKYRYIHIKYRDMDVSHLKYRYTRYHI